MALDEELPGLDVLLLEEESALAVSGVTPEELRAYPGLARLLEELGCAPSGGELRQAAWELAQQREAWLRWESLWRGLRELLLETPTHETPALEPAVRRALERSLLLAELRHRAPALASLLPPAEDPSLLRARVLPVLERHLAHKVQEVARYYSGGTAAPQNPSPAPQDPSSAPQDPSSAPPGPPKGVAEALADDQSRLRRARIRSRRLEQLLAQQRGAYSQVLGRCAALLGRLAGESCAGARAELDGHHAEYLEAKGVAVLLKVRLEELRLLLDTYPREKVEAHRLIRAGLEAGLERAAAEASQARAALEAFEALGPTFAAMAAEYGRLQERLRHRRWALRQLRAPAPGPAPRPETPPPGPAPRPQSPPPE
ncbi:HAUS augmin-like complex subunit 4 isoform X1 [Phalacrocorax carbo]|uniref:HAUS augmin-like complex subunit 4 isoform X1 n=1 Tax=Phalacrocorax carbo TaxID=9209 RepID=UPI0031197FA1